MSRIEDSRRRPEVAAGMAAARERGVRLGRPAQPLPASAERAGELRARGLSLAEIAAALTAETTLTPSGRAEWTRSSVRSLLARWDQTQQPTGG